MNRTSHRNSQTRTSRFVRGTGLDRSYSSMRSSLDHIIETDDPINIAIWETEHDISVLDGEYNELLMKLEQITKNKAILEKKLSFLHKAQKSVIEISQE